MKSSRVTDSLLHPGRGHCPSYGINEESEERSESVNSGAKVSVFHIKERIWTVAAFSLIACLGSLVVGMMLGYSTNTLAELSTLWHDNEDHTYGIANGTWTASWFGVSFFPSKSSPFPVTHYSLFHHVV